MLNFPKKWLLPSVLVGMLLPLSSMAYASNTFGNPNMTQSLNYGLLHFSTTASKKVENDQINATLNKEIQHQSSSQLANQIATTLNKAIEIAKQYPEVKVSSGNQSTYPQYNKQNKITGWTGSASLHLQSTDIVATSKLIADLQSFMTLDNVNFSVSDNTRKKVEQELMLQASKDFQQQAKTLLPAWQAQDYQLVNLQFSKGYDYHDYDMPRMAMAVEASASAKVSQQNFQVGESTINITASGAVQLVK